METEADFAAYLTTCAVPVFRATPSELPEHVGSGVLVLTPSARWLVTAAHVIAFGTDSEILLPGRPSLIPIYGTVYSTSELNPTGIQNDPFDLAFVRIGDKRTRALQDAGKGFHGTAENEILGHHKDFQDTWCYVCGFPMDSVKVAESGVQAEVFMYRGSVHADVEMKVRRFDPARQIGIRYGQMKDTAGKPIKRPDPHGMSGGPIWIYDAGRSKLAGLTIEFDGKKKLIAGVRLMDLFRAMERHA